MKRVHKDLAPNYKGPAKLFRQNNLIAEVHCNIWLPRHIYERPFLTFESMNEAHEKLPGPLPYDMVYEVNGFDNKRQNIIKATRMFIEKFKVSYSSYGAPPLITFQGQPESVINCFKPDDVDNGSGKRHVVLDLTENFLLTASKIIERKYTGEVKIKNVRTHTASIGPLSEVVFDKHFYNIEMKDGGLASYGKLVATLNVDFSVRNTETFERLIKPAIDDYLLIASFAANQRTNIISWSVSDNKSVVQAWYGNISVDDTHNEKQHSHYDVLIDIRDFEKFMMVAVQTFNRFNDQDKDLVRQAIFKVLPKRSRIVESAILTLFSALESIILKHRKDKNLEYTISNSSKWKKLEKILRATVTDNNGLFPSDEHMRMLLEMLPSLKRVSLKNAFNSYVRDVLDLSDLWPVFGPAEGATLNDVRNKLIHGDTFDEDRFSSLCHAMDNLDCIVKRLILFTLGWDIEKSNVSRKILQKWGWIPNANLRKDMLVLDDRTPRTEGEDM